MTPIQALQILANAASMANLPLQAHEQWKQAAETLSQFVNQQQAPAADTPAE